VAVVGAPATRAGERARAVTKLKDPIHRFLK